MVVVTTPPIGVRLTVLKKPPTVESETWKPVGAVTLMGPVRLVPEAVKLCNEGLVEGSPIQVEIDPLVVETVIFCP